MGHTSKQALSGVLAVSLASASLLSIAAAQETAPTGAQENQPQKDVGDDVVTVYATLNPISVFDYPGQVTVIDRSEIDLINPSAISDVLRDVPGVEFSGGPRRTGETPSIRGRGGENVLILLDGARQSFVSAHDGRFFLEPDLLRSAEVVRGPASALYGSGAVGGVLAFETVDATDLLKDGENIGAQIRLGYQSVNEETLISAIGFTRQGNLDLVGSIAKRDSGDIELGSGADLPSDDDIVSGLLKGTYAFSEDFEIDASWQRFDNSAVEPNNGQGVALSGDPILGADVDKDITTDTYRLRAKFNPSTNDLIDATFTLYNTQTEVDEFDQSIPRRANREIETTGLSARNTARFSSGNLATALTIGVDWYKDEQEGLDDNAADGTRGGVPNGETEFTGLFAQLETSVEEPFGLPGKLLVIPGVRYDEFESEAPGISADRSSDDATSARFAASYSPNDTFQFFASYAEGFRAPSINQLFLDGVHFSLPHPVLFNPAQGSFVFINNNFIANPDLKPESAETIEAGFGIDLDNVFSANDALRLKASYYESDVEDLINLSVDFAFDPTCFAPPTFLPCTAGTSNSANVDQAELSGVELEASYETPRLYSRLSYSSIEGEDKSDGSDLGVLTPDRLALDTRLLLDEWNASLGARVQIADDYERRSFDATSGMFVIDEERDGYTVLDLYGTWSPEALGGVRIDLGVDNVFEEDYERVFQGVSEPGRNFKIALTWRTGR